MRLWVLLPLLLAGCHANRAVTLPDGSQGISVDCSGTARNISHCMDKAAKACGGPYEVIAQDGSTTGAVLIPNGYGGGTVVAGVRRNMIVRCK